ncbi:MAG: site-specific DNA-methyltransferase, partial [Phycisphaerales bacterium]|nr:site-specific DNA-methyltransferase [Phycisphaerales bacterium]
MRDHDISLFDGRVVILIGDVLERLKDIPDNSIDCVVTSPPYWGLRDYGVDGQIGLEPTLAEHLDILVEVFAEIWRVLKPTGTVWLNYGDCYATTPNGRSAEDCKADGADDRTFRDKPISTVGEIGRMNAYRRGGGNNPSGPIYEQSSSGGARGDQKRPHDGVPQGRVVAGGYLKPKDLCMIPNRLAIALQDWGWWVRAECIWCLSGGAWVYARTQKGE